MNWPGYISKALLDDWRGGVAGPGAKPGGQHFTYRSLCRVRHEIPDSPLRATPR